MSTQFLTRNALQAALITDSYQIQKYNHDESEYYATRGGTENNLLTENSESRSEDDENENENENANGGSEDLFKINTQKSNQKMIEKNNSLPALTSIPL